MTSLAPLQDIRPKKLLQGEKGGGDGKSKAKGEGWSGKSSPRIGMKANEMGN